MQAPAFPRTAPVSARNLGNGITARPGISLPTGKEFIYIDGTAMARPPGRLAVTPKIARRSNCGGGSCLKIRTSLR